MQVLLISFSVCAMPHLPLQRVQISPFVLEPSLPGALNTVICDDDDDDDDGVEEMMMETRGKGEEGEEEEEEKYESIQAKGWMENPSPYL